MRTAPLPLLALIFAGCAASDAGQPVFIADFIDRSEPARCTLASELSARQAVVEDAVTVGDTSFLILYAQDREVALVGPDLVPRTVITFDQDGPTGVLGPTAVALVGDSLLYFADQKRQAIRVLDLSGRDRGTIHLDFPPYRILNADGELLVTPLVIGRHTRSLVHALEGEETRSLSVPIAFYDDPAVTALTNMANGAAYPDGRVVLAHTMVLPYAYVLGTDGTFDRVPLPLPDGVRSKFGWLPTTQFTNAMLDEILITTIAAAPDRTTGDFLYLTRTGRTRDGRPEKALIRVDPELRYLHSYLLDFNAVHLAYLAQPGIALIADEEDRWFRCETP